MSNFPNSSSSLTGSTSNPPDRSGRKFTSSYTGPFGTVVPSFDSDGHINGVYDLEGNLHAFDSDATHRCRISGSGLGASPTLVTASSKAPSTMKSMAGGGSMSRASSSMNSNYTPPIQFGNVPQDLGLRQNEDFHALPGYTGSNADYQMHSHHQELKKQSQPSSMGRPGVFYFGSTSKSHNPRPQQHAQAVSSGAISSQTGGSPSIGSTSVNAAMGYDQPLQRHQATSQYRGQTLSAIGQTFKPMQATTQPNPDPYCMLGLLSVLKNSNPDATTLALGMDLTAMGLDMNSKEKSLFKTFASPWANEPLEDDHDEFTIPQCYNAIQYAPPHQTMYRILKLETLFYIFYSMPKDVVQLYAANELNNRGWFFHKRNMRWLVRIGEPQVETYTYEIGTYDCFETDKFECVRMEKIVILKAMVERRPSLPHH